MGGENKVLRRGDFPNGSGSSGSSCCCCRCVCSCCCSCCCCCCTCGSGVAVGRSGVNWDLGVKFDFPLTLRTFNIELFSSRSSLEPKKLADALLSGVLTLPPLEVPDPSLNTAFGLLGHHLNFSMLLMLISSHKVSLEKTTSLTNIPKSAILAQDVVDRRWPTESFTKLPEANFLMTAGTSRARMTQLSSASCLSLNQWERGRRSVLPATFGSLKNVLIVIRKLKALLVTKSRCIVKAWSGTLLKIE